MSNESGREIETKYLIYETGIDYTTKEFKKIFSSINDLKQEILKNGNIITQGYLPIIKGLEIANSINLKFDFEPSVSRLRSITYKNNNLNKTNDKYFFALKGKGTFSRPELEPEINKKNYSKYWKLTKGRRIKKIRLNIPHDFYTIEFDLYIDDRPDLIIAEIELKKESDRNRIIPIGKDVTEDTKYKNSSLAK